MTEEKPVNTKIDEPVKKNLKHIISSIFPEFPATKNMKLLIDASVQLVIFEKWEKILSVKDKEKQSILLDELKTTLEGGIKTLTEKNLIYDDSRRSKNEDN